MKIEAGDCFHLSSGVTHLWVALCDPFGDPARIVLVNFTDERNTPDKTLVLVDGHSYITKPTAINYPMMRDVDAVKLSIAVDGDISIRHRHTCTADLLSKIRAGVFASPFTPNKYKVLCKSLW